VTPLTVWTPWWSERLTATRRTVNTHTSERVDNRAGRWAATTALILLRPIQALWWTVLLPGRRIRTTAITVTVTADQGRWARWSLTTTPEHAGQLATNVEQLNSWNITHQAA
jgi:hypothetical protein